MFANHAVCDIALAPTRAVVNNIDDCRFAGFRRASDDAQLAQSEGNLPQIPFSAVKNDFRNLQAHGVTPHAEKIFAVVPVAANQRPIKPDRSTQARASSVNRGVLAGVAVFLLPPMANSPFSFKLRMSFWRPKRTASRLISLRFCTLPANPTSRSRLSWTQGKSAVNVELGSASRVASCRTIGSTRNITANGNGLFVFFSNSCTASATSIAPKAGLKRFFSSTTLSDQSLTFPSPHCHWALLVVWRTRG